MSNEKVKETHVKIPVPRLLKLVSGEQVIAGILVQEGSDFLRLSDPYKIDLHNEPVVDDQYWIEERMALRPWVFQSTDKIFSIHKNNVMTLAVPNDSLKDYYNNLRMNYNKKLEPLQDKLKREKDSMQKLLDRMNDEDYYDTMEYLKGNKTKH
tara:strand:+ start:339 stop:797 length:459 start_codon:yes stop_codon:yes gene_type:complete